jgi:hypothetical protein
MAISHAEAGKLGWIKSQVTQRKQFEERSASYLQNPVRCRACDMPIPYQQRKKKQFCNRSCAAKFNNRIDVAPKRKRADRPTVCANCPKALRRGQFVYCSNKCQHLFRRRQQIEHGSASSRTMKLHLIEIYGERCLNPQCAWNFDQLPVRVELEHIDGNPDNNNLYNTTLLCPNCHSLTPTYKNRNKGNGRAYRRQRYAEGKSY